ncbi:Dihydropteroate synthase [Dethiosulfatibacter aminovorans DSM 17477]|uniref:Dihydropteroate synthase n=1 Tax=Dethiosulfatibacter aminovorans DSM 17477 TaxID=1121476 RepID=A0A1M6GQJ5_9FIRM|nr:dihydropteroate synthase [Dethiosulfatibacter aminovorans]SHJ12193.1 Dihydropteroate synthase [Dethiosulfatibacter aminovorans DSM 17477]
MRIGNKDFDFDKEAYIMGILNVTPDSFSDGGRFNSVDEALKQAEKMIEEGAHIIDIGGESTRPSHDKVEIDEEISRVVPVIEALRKRYDVPVSIDTSKSRVAEAALDVGADMINDVWGFKRDEYIAGVARDFNVPCCLMHNRVKSGYVNLMEEVLDEMGESVQIALDAGVSSEKIMIDPGIGFAKTPEENLIVMKNLEMFGRFGLPVLLGTSRKSMIGYALDLPVGERLEGTIATTVFGYMKGCRIFRVHDVKENLRALRMVQAMS